MKFITEFEYNTMKALVVELREDKDKNNFYRAEGIMFVLEELKDSVDCTCSSRDLGFPPPNEN